MRPLQPDEQPLVEAAIAGLQVRWATWLFSVAATGAEVDEEGEIHLPCSLASFSVDGALLGAAESRRPLLHLADLGAMERTQAYFRAVAASLPGLAAARGWEGGDVQGESAFSEVLPGGSLLEDLALQSFDDFLGCLGQPAWLDADADPPDPEHLPDPRDLSETKPVAHDPEQEAELSSWPTALWPFARYGRWLTERGDPRGALAGAQLGVAIGAQGHDPRTGRYSEREARRLLDLHARYLLGPFAPRGGVDPFGDQVVFTWRLGFIERIELRFDLASSGPAPADLLAGALALPASRLARDLVLSVAPLAFEREDRRSLPRWTEALVASGGHPRVRSILLAAAPSLEDNPYLDPVEGPPILTEAEDMEAIRSAFPVAKVSIR